MKRVHTVLCLRVHPGRLTGILRAVAVGGIVLLSCSVRMTRAAELQAGAAKVDITHRDAPVNDPLHSRALVLKTESTTAVIVTMDVVSLGEIGHIKNDFLDNVRNRIEKELGIPPTNVMINTSHCHGTPCADVEERTFQAVGRQNGSRKTDAGHGRRRPRS